MLIKKVRDALASRRPMVAPLPATHEVAIVLDGLAEVVAADTSALRDAITGWEQGGEDENISLDDRLEQGYALCEAAQALLNRLEN